MIVFSFVSKISLPISLILGLALVFVGRYDLALISNVILILLHSSKFIRFYTLAQLILSLLPILGLDILYQVAIPIQDVFLFSMASLLIGYISPNQQISTKPHKTPIFSDTDPVSQLPGYSSFKDHLKKVSQDLNHQYFILHFKITGVNQINHLYGTDQGDSVIKSMVNEFNLIIPQDAFLSRFASLQFHLYLPFNNQAQVEDLFEEFQKELEVLNSQFNNVTELKIFAGAVKFPSDSDLIRELLNFANTSRVHSFDTSKQPLQFFKKKILKKALRSLQIQTQFLKALQDNEFELHFQPKINTKTHRISGIEALIRWRNHRLGFVSPAEFIPIAEESGYIIPLGKFVILEGIKFLAHLESLGYESITLSINVSPKQFFDPHFVPLIETTLKNYYVHPNHLEIEITEGLLLEDNEEIKTTIFKLKDLGIGLALDDFGTGYASLSYLTQYPFTCLKIDRSFVGEIEKSKPLQSIVKNCIQLGNDLDLETIAEGVENETQLKFLENNSCDTIQGWYYSKALSATDFEDYILQFQNPSK